MRLALAGIGLALALAPGGAQAGDGGLCRALGGVYGEALGLIKAPGAETQAAYAAAVRALPGVTDDAALEALVAAGEAVASGGDGADLRAAIRDFGRDHRCRIVE